MTGEKLIFNLFFNSYHGSGVFPLGEFVKYPQQVDAGKQVTPAVGQAVSVLLQNKEGRKCFI